MIKILWNQCECQVEVAYQGLQSAQFGYQGPKTVEQCGQVGKERTFADGHKEFMCDAHWTKCTGIVDKDGAKHLKPETPADPA